MMRLLRHQFRVEQLLFWRSRELAFFTFLFPIIFLVLLGSAYGNDTVDGVRGYTYLLSGLLGYGAAATTFAGLGILLVLRRESGTLKRIRATPLPGATYLAGLFGSFVFVYLLQAVILVLLARAIWDVPVPTRWLSLLVVLLDRRGVVHGARRGDVDVHPHGRRVVRGDQRHLPAGRVPRRSVLLDEVVPAGCAAGSPTSCRCRTSSGSSATSSSSTRTSGTCSTTSRSSPRGACSGSILAVRRFRWEPSEH